MLNNLKTATPIKNLKLNNFFYGPFFPAYIAVLCVACYTLNTPLIGLAVMAFFACILLIIYEDLTPFICLPSLVITLFRDVNNIVNLATIFILSPVAVCLILHFILYPPRKIFNGKLTLPLLLVTITLFSGGLFSPYITEYAKAVVFSVASGPVLLIVYLLFRQYVKPPKEFDLKNYACYLLVIIGLVATADTAIYKFYLIKALNISHKLIDEMGWNNVNGVASLLLVCVCASAYLLTKSKKPLFAFGAFVILCAGIFITNSFGGIGTLIVMLPVIVYFIIAKATKRAKNLLPLYFLMILAILVVGGGLYFAKFNIQNSLHALYKELSRDHGRTALLTEAYELFKKYPFFGVSMGYVNPDTSLKVNSVVAYNFHSTPLHILATTGIVGFVAYLYYYIARYKMIMNNDGTFNLFVFIGFSAFQAYGFIDTCEFNVIPCMLILTIFFSVLEKINEKSNDKPLPLKSLY